MTADIKLNVVRMLDTSHWQGALFDSIHKPSSTSQKKKKAGKRIARMKIGTTFLYKMRTVHRHVVDAQQFGKILDFREKNDTTTNLYTGQVFNDALDSEFQAQVGRRRERNLYETNVLGGLEDVDARSIVSSCSQSATD